MLNHAFDESPKTKDPTLPIWRLSPLECPSLCRALGNEMHQGSGQLHEKGLPPLYLPILWTTQSCWQRGQRLFCFTHRDMQQLWKEWLHSPQTTEKERKRSFHIIHFNLNYWAQTYSLGKWLTGQKNFFSIYKEIHLHVQFILKM